jgi:hypothetical protein
MHPDRGRADEAGDVGRHALLLHELEIFAEAGPLDRIFDVALPCGLERFHRRVPRAHGLAFAHHLQRNALPNIALPAAVGDQRLVGPAQHVDEPGSDRQPSRVNHLLGRKRAAPDADNPVALDRNIADVWRLAATVIDCPAAQQDVGG